MMVFFYLLLIDGALISAYLIFRGDFLDKMKLTNISGIGIGMGLIIGVLLVVVELGFYGAFSITIPYTVENVFAGAVYVFFLAFIVGNAEEIFFRGFLPSIAEKYGRDAQDIRISKYVMSPALFGIAHYFSWEGSLFIGSLYLSVFMFLYHFVFGVAMQYLVDYYDSLYTSITAHTIYDGMKMIMSLGGV